MPTEQRTRTSDTDTKRVPSFFGIVAAGIVLSITVEVIERASPGAGWMLALIIVIIMLMQYPFFINQATNIISGIGRG